MTAPSSCPLPPYNISHLNGFPNLLLQVFGQLSPFLVHKRDSGACQNTSVTLHLNSSLAMWSATFIVLNHRLNVLDFPLHNKIVLIPRVDFVTSSNIAELGSFSEDEINLIFFAGLLGTDLDSPICAFETAMSLP
ncbi:hypothetical protein L3X38_036003 [Prunus dulcis]|uniref:Uncharacterized protein n=1 Tax=Prunus dulcis TaxID=3755 RepID=A0AAD4YP23_PRUDU|nr:hypothetical protein L3X38_036003 [Prunus dulcis]